jgi:N-acetylmuramoyl-L-alanine amidase
MSGLRLVLLLVLCWVAGLASGAAASGYSALARADAARSSVHDAGGGVEIALHLSQPVPWRAYTLDAPRRLVLEFSEVVWDAPVPVASARVGGVRAGPLGPGWSRMVVDLETPLVISEAGLRTGESDGSARLELRLAPASPSEFAAAAGAPPEIRRALPPTVIPALPPRPAGRLRVVLDPGHGGIDPGAEYDGMNEARMMLTFARELRELLLRAGVEVVMTRDADIFVPLEARISVARAAEADLFLSLHADSLPEGSGSAHGATVYTLSDEASDRASQRLAERHDGADLMAGVDLTGQGHEIALVLMDMARLETQPRSDSLARHLVEGLSSQAGGMNRRPLRSASFSVLKSPDIPSVLVELGFLSSARDREKIASAEWRTKAAAGIRDAVLAWAAEDAARARLLRTRP